MVISHEELIDVLNALYFDHLVKILKDHDIPHTVALSIATDFFDTMKDFNESNCEIH